MSEHPHIPTKILVYIGIAVGILICILMTLSSAFEIHPTWPAYLALPIFFLAGSDTSSYRMYSSGLCLD
jgi:hypothetical protein